MRSSWVNQVALNLMPRTLLRREDMETKRRNTGEKVVWRQADGGVRCLQAKKQQEFAAATSSYKAGKEQILAQSLPREATLLTPWFQTSRLQSLNIVLSHLEGRQTTGEPKKQQPLLLARRGVHWVYCDLNTAQVVSVFRHDYEVSVLFHQNHRVILSCVHIFFF